MFLICGGFFSFSPHFAVSIAIYTIIFSEAEHPTRSKEEGSAEAARLLSEFRVSWLEKDIFEKHKKNLVWLMEKET